MSYEVILPENYVKPILPGLKAWVAALRSGEYVKGVGALCQADMYCCLGVLSKIQNRLNLINDEWCDGSDRNYLDQDNPLYDILIRCGLFPGGVKVKTPWKTHYSLAECNDQDFDFSAIADIIEKVWQDPE